MRRKRWRYVFIVNWYWGALSIKPSMCILAGESYVCLGGGREGCLIQRGHDLSYFRLGKRTIIGFRTNCYDYWINDWRSYIGYERLAGKDENLCFQGAMQSETWIWHALSWLLPCEHSRVISMLCQFEENLMNCLHGSPTREMVNLAASRHIVTSIDLCIILVSSTEAHLPSYFGCLSLLTPTPSSMNTTLTASCKSPSGS